MSYDLRLVDPVTKEGLHVDKPHQMAGGTHAIGGTTELWLNITYNYGEIFRRVFNREKGIRALYGMTGAQSIPLLEAGMRALKDDVDDDYWKATEGNAKQALAGLLAIAQMRPDGVWDGD